MVLKYNKKEGSKNKEKRQSQVVSMQDPQLGKEKNKGQRSCTPSGSPHNMSLWCQKGVYYWEHFALEQVINCLVFFVSAVINDI